MNPEPYASTWKLPRDDHGWFRNHDQLRAALAETPANTVVELGSWLGLSARFMARLLSPGGKLYCIDTWAGSAEHWNIPDFEVQRRLVLLYQQFLSNVMHDDLCNQIIPFRTTTLEGARMLMVRADLVYVDAAHDEESVYQDIMAWHAKLAPGGIMCGDDWDWPSVQAGVTRAANELNRSLVGSEGFWRFINTA